MGRLFSLFNVVEFKNDPCLSTDSISGSKDRNGTCLTNTECNDRGGSVNGNCASGFGVCCVFILQGGSGDVSQNCTYLQNEGFPDPLTGTDTVTYTVNKCSNDVCDLRLDFETFTTRGPGDTLEVTGGVCPDTFVVTTNTQQTIPTVCGTNSGQHMYVNIGNQESDTATLTFTFTGTSAIRRYDIKVTQVKCNSEYNSPDTCLQYHVGQTGTIKTFNFDATTEETHLASQSYSVCIRPEEGFCCIEYSACRGVTGSFTPTTNVGPAAAQVDSQCSEDYIVIDGGMAVCSRLPGAVNTRFCGGFLNNIASQTANAAVCDCQPPFVVGITFDAGADAGAADNSAYTFASRGVCLEYRQVTCA